MKPATCRRVTRWGLALSVCAGWSQGHPSPVPSPLPEQPGFPERGRVCRDWRAARREELTLGTWGTPTPTWGSISRRRGGWDLRPPSTTERTTSHLPLPGVISIFMRVGVFMNMLIRHHWLLPVPCLPSSCLQLCCHLSRSHSPGSPRASLAGFSRVQTWPACSCLSTCDILFPLPFPPSPRG